MAGIPVPPFALLPVATITDEADPDRAEIVTFRGQASAFAGAVLPLWGVMNPGQPQPGGALPNNPAVGADAAARVARMVELRAYVQNIFNAYAPAHAAFTAALAAAAAPAPPPAAPAPRPPKMKTPELFTGKSTTEARHFVRQCRNYLAVQNMPDPETEIRWMLGLLTGEAAQWRDEKLDEMTAAQPLPVHMADWDDFANHFEARWTDPHEEEKQLDRIMKGAITQRTSVKIYNDLFNEAVGLTTLTGANTAILRAYTTGLKPMVRNLSIAPLRADPNMTFHARQTLMVDIDESLMQTRQPTAPAPARRTVINNPVINVQGTTAPGTPAPARGTTPARATTPAIKIEAARQYTKLTPEERTQLARTGGCFRCRQQGHMARDCPRNAITVNAATVPEESAPATTESTETPASDF